VAETRKVQKVAAAQAADITKQLQGSDIPDNLADLTRKDLLDLALTLDVGGRSAMNKPELIKAIKSASRRRR
jgi:hypothetical protein